MRLRRDSLIWTLLFVAALITYGGAHTTTLIPAAYTETAKDIATVLGFIAAYLTSSPLGPGRPEDMEPPKETR